MAIESRPLLDARLRLARQCRRSRSYRDLQGIAHTQSNLDRIAGLQWQTGTHGFERSKQRPSQEALQLDTVAPSKAT
jgi:hypothetical protein